MSDQLLQAAVLWRLQTLVESATQLSDEVKGRHPEIPWRDMRGFRNIVVHGYVDRLDPDLVWAYVANDLDALGRLAGFEIARLEEH